MTRKAKFEALEVKRSALDVNAGYTRRQPIIEVEFTCEICGKHQTVEQLPGATPKYCPDGDCKKEANRRRVAEFRARKKSEKGS